DRVARAGHRVRPRAGRLRRAAARARQALGQSGAPGRGPGRGLGSAGRSGADGDAPARPAQSLRAAQGTDPRPRHQRGLDARIHCRTGPAGRREATPARPDPRPLHRPRRHPGRRGLSTMAGRRTGKPARSLPIEVDASGHPPLGMPAADFLRDYWQKRPLLVRNAFPGFETPLAPEDMAGLACEDYALSRIVMHDRATDTWELRTGPFPEELFPTLPRQDWTLLVQDVDKWDPDVAAL